MNNNEINDLEIARAAYDQRITSLLKAFALHREPPQVVSVTPAASKALADFGDAVKRHMTRWHLPDSLLGYPRRWAEIAYKLTLVLHAATHGGDAVKHAVSETTAINAVRLMKWFAAQQEQLLHEYVEAKARPKYGKALEIVEGAPLGITARDVARKSAVFRDATEAAEILKQLAKEGQINCEGGRKSPIYRRRALPRQRS